MYRSTLTFYSKVVGKRYNFVFVENSNVDLTSLKKEFEDKLNIEFLQFTSNAVLSDSIFSVDKFDNTKGKGYNEYLMIKKAILQSKYLNEASHFLKITGRYAILLNFSRQYRGDSRCIFRFRHQVQFNGVSGTVTSERLCQGIRTQASFSNRMKNEIRHILRVLFPNIWF